MTNPSDTAAAADFADLEAIAQGVQAEEATLILGAEPVLARSILTLTEQEGNPAGFTIGLLLASHGQAEDDSDIFRIPVVDIVMLAVVNTLKTVPDGFKAEIDKVNSAIAKLGEDLAKGVVADVAVSEFNASVGMPAYVRSEG